MESEQFSQGSSVNSVGRWLHRLPSADEMRSQQSDEGGLSLGQIVSALRRRLPIIIGTTAVISSAAVLKGMMSKPVYQSQFEILTKPVTVESQVLSSVPQTLSNREQQQTSPEKPIDDTKLKLLKSPKLLNPIVEELKPRYPDINYDTLSLGLVVTALPNSEILAVSFNDPNSEKVKAVLQSVSEAYVAYSLEERLADIRQGLDFVNLQVPKLRDRVKAIQDLLQIFRQQNDLIDPETTGKQLAEQTSALGQQRLDTEIKLGEARALVQDLSEQQARTDSDFAASSALRDNPRYQEMLKKLLEVETQLAKTNGLYRSNSPHVQLLKDQLQNLQPLLGREGARTKDDVDSQVRFLDARKQILERSDDLLKQRVKQLSTTSRQYTDIQQELKIATDNLNQFLTKQEALRIDAGQRKAPWQILTPPVEPKPAAGNLRQTAILGVILGVLLGVGGALLLEKLSNVLRTPEEAKDLSKLPILGIIPFTPEGMEVLHQVPAVNAALFETPTLVHQVRQRLGIERESKSSRHHINSEFLEAFRSLYTNIRLLNPDAHIRSLVISSASGEEGKSTIALNLAQAAAALGQRVLLVEADLRNPQLHQRLGITNIYGLSSVVSSEVEFEEAIQQLSLDPNLSVLTAGQIPPDPTPLLSSKKMQSLMQQFEENYDLVIYDTPPLNGLIDAKILSANTDGIVLTVRLDKTRTADLKQSMDALKLSSVTPLGIVANGSKD
jgi:polysaccharide biosynthesis transport protein